MENVDVKEFEIVLDSSKGEREVSRYLKEHPWIIYWTLCSPGGNSRYMFSEFTLGAEFRTDFLILNGYSGLWKALFIELEPVTARFFNKNKSPSKILSLATKQINEWKKFIDFNKENLRIEFCRWSTNKDILNYSIPSSNPSNGIGYLKDLNSFLHFEFYIIMGRRSNLNEDNLYYKGSYSNNFNFNISLITYDRLLDLAKERYLSDYFINRQK